LLPLLDSELERNEAAVAQYQAALAGDQETLYYLQVERELEEGTLASARVGLVDDPHPGHEGLEGWLVIPYLGLEGEVLKIRFRRPPGSDHKAKYRDLPHATPRIYNVQALQRARDWICITEGEFDTMALGQIGIPSIALPGAQAWKPHYRKVLAGFSRIHLLGDPDDAGREFNDKIQQAMRVAHAVKLSKDVNDTLVEEGPDAIWEAIGEERG